MEQNGTEKIKHTSTTIIGILTIIVTLIAAIPSFLTLNDEHPKIYYSTAASDIKIPSALNEKDIKTILTDNGIPLNTVSVSLINQGNGAAKSVMVSIKVPGEIVTAWSVPSEADSPIWVKLPKIAVAQNQDLIVLPLVDLAITKPLIINIGYNPKSGSETEQVEVFYDGKPAEKVTDVNNVSPWSPWDIFRIPITILISGIIIVLIWAFGVVILNNPPLQETMVSLVGAVAKELVNSIAISRIFFK